MNREDILFRTKADQVAVFIEDNGHLPRASIPASEEKKLGVWVAANRQALRKGSLSPVRREILSALDLTPNKDRRWEAKLELLAEHVSNSDIRPRRGSEDPEEAAIAEWLIIQLHKMKSGSMSAERRHRFLERFPDGTFRTVITFDERVELIAHFLKENGRLPLSRRPNEHELATWMIQMRMKLKDGTLGPERTAALERIPGALATIQIANTDDALEELRAWCEAHGHHPRSGVGTGRDLTEAEVLERRIADWARNHGQGTKTTSGSKDRQKSILSILAEYPEPAEHRSATIRAKVRAALEARGYVPKTSEDPKTNAWVFSRRSSLKNGLPLSPEDQELLAYAESLPTAMDVSRTARLQELETFVEAHGRMPGFATTATKQETGLSFWVKRRLDNSRTSGDPAINRRIYQIITDHGIKSERVRRPLDASMATEISTQLKLQGHQLRAGTTERAWLDRYRVLQRAGEPMSSPVLAVLTEAAALPTYQEHRQVERLEDYRAFTETHGCPPSHLQGTEGISLATWARRIRMSTGEGTKDVRDEIHRINAALNHKHAA